MTKPETCGWNYRFWFVIRIWEFFNHSDLGIRASVPVFINPLVLLQPCQRAPDALFNLQRRFPAGALNFFCVEENERVVADPAAAAAGVFELRFQAERATDVADGFVDLHIFVRAEVVDFHAVPCFFGGAKIDDVQHRADAVLNVEITFPLRTVAKNFQTVGMLEQLLVKIKNMAVRVAFTENGHEAENVALEFETFAVGGNHAFRSEERRVEKERRS